jgi:hypothetical protein
MPQRGWVALNAARIRLTLHFLTRQYKHFRRLRGRAGGIDFVTLPGIKGEGNISSLLYAHQRNRVNEDLGRPVSDLIRDPSTT